MESQLIYSVKHNGQEIIYESYLRTIMICIIIQDNTSDCELVQGNNHVLLLRLFGTCFSACHSIEILDVFEWKINIRSSKVIVKAKRMFSNDNEKKWSICVLGSWPLTLRLGKWGNRSEPDPETRKLYWAGMSQRRLDHRPRVLRRSCRKLWGFGQVIWVWRKFLYLKWGQP